MQYTFAPGSMRSKDSPTDDMHSEKGSLESEKG